MLPELQRVTIFGRRVLASIIRVRISRRVTGVLQRERTGQVKTDAELRGGSTW